jgi:hypothetical protein
VALKKSELYSSLWSSCDALRGGMDASQYKDYVLGQGRALILSWHSLGGSPECSISLTSGMVFSLPACRSMAVVHLCSHKVTLRQLRPPGRFRLPQTAAFSGNDGSRPFRITADKPASQDLQVPKK